MDGPYQGPNPYAEFLSQIPGNIVNQYTSAMQNQQKIQATNQAMAQEALKAKYAPQDLYNQQIQQNTATIKGMKPFEASLMDSMLRRIESPVKDMAQAAQERIINAGQKQENVPLVKPQSAGAPPNPMDPSITKRAVDIVNPAFNKGKPIERAPQSVGAEQISGPGFSYQPPQGDIGPMPNVPPQVIAQAQSLGPQDLVRAPAQSAPIPGYNPQPSGINMADPRAVQKFAQGSDPSQMLSSDFDKVYPATASAIAMSMRNIPNAVATQANNQNSTMTQLTEAMAKLAEMDTRGLNKDQLAQKSLEEKSLFDQMKMIVEANKTGAPSSKTGRPPVDHGPEQAAARDKNMLDEVSAKDKTARETYMPQDRKAANAAILNAYQNAETNIGKQHLWNLYSDFLQKNGMAPPAAATSFKPSKAAHSNQAPAGGGQDQMIQVKRKSDGAIGPMPSKNFNPAIYDKVQ